MITNKEHMVDNKESQVLKKEVFFTDENEKELLNVICKEKNQNPLMPFTEICEMYDDNESYVSRRTKAEVLETLFSGKDNYSNKIVNTIIQLMIDYEINCYETVFYMIPMVYYTDLNLYELSSVLYVIIEVDSFSKELTAAGFDFNSVLLKMVKNYQERKALAMTGSLLIDDNFYGLCADKLK
jgi:hypothetical protein